VYLQPHEGAELVSWNNAVPLRHAAEECNIEIDKMA